MHKDSELQSELIEYSADKEKSEKITKKIKTMSDHPYLRLIHRLWLVDLSPQTRDEVG